MACKQSKSERTSLNGPESNKSSKKTPTNLREIERPSLNLKLSEKHQDAPLKKPGKNMR